MAVSRKHIPSTTSLRVDLDDIELEINSLLQVNPLQFEDPKALHELASDIKRKFETYCDISRNLSSRALRAGSVSETVGIRNERTSLRADVNETLGIISRLKLELDDENESLVASTLLDPLERLDVNLDSENSSYLKNNFASIQNPISTTEPNPVFSASSVLESNVKHATFSSPLITSVYSTPSCDVTLPVISQNSNFIDSVTTTIPSVNTTYQSAKPTETLAFTNSSSYPRVTSTYLPPISRSQLPQFSGFSGPRPQPPLNFYIPSVDSNQFSKNFIVGRPPLVDPSLSSVPRQPMVSDPASFHLLRQEVLRPSGKPFNGDPHEYHCWINVISNKVKGIALADWDILTVLHANSSGKPRKLIEQHMSIGGINPRQTLENVWEALLDQYGSGTQIANSILSKVSSFPLIKDPQNVEQLRELLSLSQLILCNISVSSELQIFHLSIGLRRIWDKLPYNLQNTWREIAANYSYTTGTAGTHPPFDIFVEFLQKKCRELSNQTYLKTPSTYIKKTTEHKVFKATEPRLETDSRKGSQSESVCPIHTTGKHSLIECKVFAREPYEEKRKLLSRSGLCFRCFGHHRQSECTANLVCSVCKKPHATVMHRYPPNNTSEASTSHDSTADSASNLCVQVCDDPSGRSCSKTLLVDLSLPSRSHKSLRCYCIIDEQSSSSFVDPKIKEFFGLPFPVQEYHLTTLSGSRISTQGHIIEGLRLKGIKENKHIQLPAVYTNQFIPNCKNEVASPSVVSSHKHISYLAKHFAKFDVNSDVLILIGRDCGPAMATKCYGFKAPYAHHTPLGWALVGAACPTSNNLGSGSLSALKTSLKENSMGAVPMFTGKLQPQEQSSFDIFSERPDDELPGISKDNARFLSILSDGITTDEKNNIVMPLPFKNMNHKFPDNRYSVLHRTTNTLNRLKSDKNKLQQCITAMGKNLANDHNIIELVPESELKPEIPGKVWYIPLFPVTQAKKNKTRLVFDSSAVYRSTSLNNELLQGPDINNQLRTVLLRFRRGEIGFSADIESMFYVFRLPTEDRDFTRFFWWKNNDPSQNIVDYRAKVHIFGNTSSPALANFGLRYAAANNPLASPSVIDFVTNNFYVDDACGCADAEDQAIDILQSTIDVLAVNNIRLHKIISNSRKVLEHFPPSETSVSASAKKFEDCSSQHTLGVEWNISTDSFVIKSNVPERPFTKRGVLSTNNSLFDPFGSVSPVILTGRLLQRRLIPPKTSNPALASLGWDDPIPKVHLPMWEEWKSSLSAMDGLVTFPRSYIPTGFSPVEDQSLHIFSDASNEGAGYVCYIRSTNMKNDVSVAFVAANSRVPPRGLTTIPRLELCAALDAASSAQQIASDIGISTESVYLYTDSKIVLGYLTNLTSSFSKYVTRRVSLILKCFPVSQWSYINTSENPADIASRPQTYQSLSKSCWFQGPHFLRQELSLEKSVSFDEELPEIIIPKVSCKVDSSSCPSVIGDLCSRISSWNKVRRIAQNVIKFIVKLGERVSRKRGYQLPFRDTIPLGIAERFVIISVQSQLLDNNSCQNLSPFKDIQGIVRVGGRLNNSDLPYHVKHPILIPSCALATLLLSHFHNQVKHQGRVITMAAVRTAGYFLQSGSSLVKKFLNSCSICRRLRRKPETQKMSELPYDRLHESPPFTYVGMDVFGHFAVTEGKTTRKNSSSKKTWAIIFTCLVTRAIHIEPLPSLDISSFKNALRRFFCLRGTCRKLRCDCGTNFIGARGQEDCFLPLEEIKSDSSFCNIEWEFNPPKASHFGGVWERKIGSVRRILDVSLMQLGPRHLSRDELHTLLAEAASIVNNTPLWEVSYSSSDPFPLTPAMLLFATANPNPPPLESFSSSDILSYGSRRWRRVQSLSDQFWARWRRHYLHNIITRKKWLRNKRSVKVGDIVLLKDKGIKRNAWPLARVTDTKASSDGLVRTVTLTLPSRSTDSRICKLVRPITEVVMILES